jgi:hypothetical protein
MNRIFFIIFSFCITTVYAQDASVWDFKDSIRGGELNIKIDKKLESILKGKEKAVCQKNVYVPPVKLTPADKCATQQKIMGYKIQIFYTKDRSAAEKVKNDFARQYPSLTPELIYAAPDYRILVGDYFTRQTAGNDLRKIQRTYPAAFPVQWRVWCRKAL